MKLEEIKLEHLLDCLPENRPLYKDSGLWQVRTDDMEDYYMVQHSNESVKAFIIRYIEFLIENDKDGEIQINLGLACSKQMTCNCTPDETTGWIETKCCNVCGKHVKD